MDESSSCYTSSYQDSSSTMAAGMAGRVVGGDSSMAVECDTIPSASSLSTVIGTVVSNYKPQMSRSQSEHRHMTKHSKKQPMKRLSAISSLNQPYSHIVRNLRYSSKFKFSHQDNPTASTSTSTNPAPHAGTWSSVHNSNAYSTINAPSSTATSYFGMGRSYAGSRTVSSSRREEGSGRPNTPVSSVTDFTTDTEGEKEKWV